MLIALNKPYGVLSQFTPDQPGQATLATFGLPADVYPVGRLDRDSEGLLLLSDEGPLIARLLDPKHAHPRTYLVQVEHVPDAAALQALRDGVEITVGKQRHRTRPAEAALLDAPPDLPPRDPPVRDRKSVADAWLRLTLGEGKNRQVRKMTAAVGYPTLRLVRVAIGGLALGDLAPGRWYEVGPAGRARLVPPPGGPGRGPNRARGQRSGVDA